MTTRRMLVSALVWFYPREWRRQYGPELRAILESEVLSAGTILDVLRGALWQRARTAAPSTILGAIVMLLVLGGIVLSPTAYGHSGTAFIRPSGKTFPTVTVTFFASEAFAVLLVACGCWTQLRYGRGAVKAAMWMTLLAGIPVMVFGALILLGGLSATIPLPGDPARTITPSPWAMMIAPSARTLESAIWGALGGQLARWISAKARPAAMAQS